MKVKQIVTKEPDIQITLSHGEAEALMYGLRAATKFDPEVEKAVSLTNVRRVFSELNNQLSEEIWK